MAEPQKFPAGEIRKSPTKIAVGADHLLCANTISEVIASNQN